MLLQRTSDSQLADHHDVGRLRQRNHSDEPLHSVVDGLPVGTCCLMRVGEA